MSESDKRKLWFIPHWRNDDKKFDPCPFCGSDFIEAFVKAGNSQFKEYVVRCINCHASKSRVLAPDYREKKSDIVDLVKMWNHRWCKNCGSEFGEVNIPRKGAKDHMTWDQRKEYNKEEIEKWEKKKNSK